MNIFLITVIICFALIHYIILNYMKENIENIFILHIITFPFSGIAALLIGMVVSTGIFNTIVKHSEKYTIYTELHKFEAIKIDNSLYYELNAENKVFKINEKYIIENEAVYDEKAPEENILYKRENHLKNKKLEQFLKYEKSDEVYKILPDKILLADKK